MVQGAEELRGDPGEPALTHASLERVAAELGAADADFGRVLERWGPPPLWDRDPGFATLVHIILEQQVSLASAAAAMRRLVEAIGAPDPAIFAELTDDQLLEIGFSRQKRAYARDLAERVLDGRLDFDELSGRSDSAVRDRLTEVKGIGEWTADVYLLMVLRRPDVWPIGDRALIVAVRELKALLEDPGPEEMIAIGEAWRPWRSVAARLLWHYYLSEVRPPPGT